MNDETYRPKKKSINIEEEVNFDPVAASKAADQLENMIKPTQESIIHPSGVQISGHMPQQMRDAIMRERTGSPAPQSNTRYSNEDPSMRVQKDSLLEKLIYGIGDKGNVVYDELRLPSLGKFYDGQNGPADGIIHLRPMIGEEESILATPRFHKRQEAINMILDRCMQERYNSVNFLSEDRTYMLIFLRGISYTSNYDVEVTDPESGHTFPTTIDLSNIWVDYCPEEFGPENLTDTLPVTGYRFRYKLETGRDEQTLNDHKEKRSKNFDLTGQADDSLLYRTAHLIEEIEGLSDKLEIMTLLRKLPIQDVAYARNCVTDPPFGVDTKVMVTNPRTLRDFEIMLPVDINFFFPRVKKNKM